MSLNSIIATQALWASRRWPTHIGRRAPSLEANLIVPMAPEVRQQFAAGGGTELGKAAKPEQPEKPGKMSSLRSSSALGYNFFAPWRLADDFGPLEQALKVRLADRTVRFECKFPHGLATEPPNLDVVLDGDQARPLAIECKFTEPYGGKRKHPPLAGKYFAGNRRRWAEVGLPRCQELAETLGRDVAFMRLGAGQLLKHLLGLAFTTKAPPRLLCLWYDAKCEEAEEHAEELIRFCGLIDGGIDFAATTYQTAFERLDQSVEPVTGYVDYLADRYFAV